MAHFPMPELERSVAIEPDLQRIETIRPHRKANLSELEQMVTEFRREKKYASMIHVMNKIDGLKPSYETDETDIPYPIDSENQEHELKYIRTYGIEKYIENYTYRSHEGLTCLRDARYLNAQLLFLENYE